MQSVNSSIAKHERGSVAVMVAIWLPTLVLFVSLAVDFAHFFDYSRNLQNRADAAALAAGVAYGGTCFGTPTTVALDTIGKTAQQYAGPPNGTPYPQNLPYPFTDAQPYQNQPNLKQGTPENLHLLLNSSSYWPTGGDWNMGANGAKGSSKALCSSTDEDGHTGAIADVRLTQANLHLFFPVFNITPSISAHARVELEQEGGSNAVIPIAVRDSAAIQCVAANFFDAASGAQITTTPASPVPLTKEGTDTKTGGVIWDLPAGVTVPMPAGNDNVYVQIVTGLCGDNPATYDAGSGIMLINTWQTATPASGQRPVITTGGVTMTGACPNDNLSNQYFTDEACIAGVTANVLFAPDAGTTTVTATDTNANCVTPCTITLTQQPGTNTYTSATGFEIDPGTGRHQIDIKANQNGGTIPSGGKTPTDCTKGQGCTTDLGVQQQAFGACNAEILACANPPDDSGPIALAQLKLKTDPAGAYGQNAFAPLTTPSLNLTLEIQGLSNAKPGDKPTVLRFSESGANGSSFTSHATGLIDCGQGQGDNQAVTAVSQGCPIAGSPACSNTPFCAPLVDNVRNSVCTPAGNSLSGAFVARDANNPTAAVDCVDTVGGTQSPIPTGVACRVIVMIGGAPSTVANCLKGNPQNTQCSANNWSPTTGAASIPADDPRAMLMIITAPEDLSKNNGPPVPIRNFATFYVTGWTSGQGGVPGCDSYAATAPGAAADAVGVNTCPDGSTGNCTGKKGGQQGQIWGYWIKYDDGGGIPLPGQTCNFASFGNCVPALTR